MTVKQIIKEALRKKKMTQQGLADAIGYKSIGGVSNALKRGNNTTVATLTDMLNAVDCKLIVRFPDGMEVQVTEE